MKKLETGLDFVSVHSQVQLLSTLSHKAISRYFACTLSKARDILVFREFYPLGSILNIYHRLDDGFTEQQMASILKPGLEGLAYLHNLQIVHEGFKASNLLVTKFGEIKLADYSLGGICEASSRDLAGCQIFWVAPEVLNGEGAGPAADMWSFAMTIIELTQGSNPYEKLSRVKAILKICSGKMPKLRHKEKWSNRFIGFLEDCFIYVPSNRATAQELLHHPFIKYNAGEQHVRDLLMSLNSYKAKEWKIEEHSYVSKKIQKEIEIILMMAARNENDEPHYPHVGFCKLPKEILFKIFYLLSVNREC